MNQLTFLVKLKELNEKKEDFIKKSELIKEQIDALDDSPKSEKQKERLWNIARNITYLIKGTNIKIKELEKEYLDYCYSLLK